MFSFSILVVNHTALWAAALMQYIGRTGLLRKLRDRAGFGPASTVQWTRWMGRNKSLREKIRGHDRMIQQHNDWIDEEEKNPNPDRDLIAHWRAEIAAVEKRRERLLRRLKRNW